MRTISEKVKKVYQLIRRKRNVKTEVETVNSYIRELERKGLVRKN
jgi:hypothetical protein